MKKTFSVCLIYLFLLVNSAFSQSTADMSSVKAYVMEHSADLNVDKADLLDIQYIHTAILRNNAGKVHYFNQAIGEVLIDGAIINVVEYTDGNLNLQPSRAEANLIEKRGKAAFLISPEEAILSAAKKLGESAKKADLTISQLSPNKYKVGKLPFTNNEVNVVKSYVSKDGRLIPVWMMEMDVTKSPDYFNIKINAETGELVDVLNYTVYCDHSRLGHNQESCGHAEHASDQAMVTSAAAGDGASYQVYAWPAESPLHGPFVIVNDPSDATASPYGWHHTNGVDGAEFTITRGNNVHAYQDREDLNSPSDDEPDGGADLQFVYDHQTESEPIFSEEAAVTNLFYSVNKMHDFAYHYGFDENNGNFQQNNYTGQGFSGDFVRAEAQDGSGTDNANFSTPNDGGNGRMQMYLWNQAGDRLVSIESPANIAGFVDVGVVSDDIAWEFEYATSPVTGKVVLATDGSFQGGTQCCNEITNISEVAGNIAMIDRGECFFIEKAARAEAAGAAACIICNVAGVNGGTGEELLNMAAGDGATTSIPTVFMAKSSCDLIRSQLAAKTGDVIVKIEERETFGPDQLDASFDNGVIAHEFGHGISTRLTGTPSNSGCLFNIDSDGDGTADRGEQMGEGWSDFFTLVTSVEEGDTGSKKQGIGTYVNGEETNGTGIRVYAYSTDFDVNPVTYRFINSASVPHGIGAVWASMIWDMYWAFVDLYGYDADITNTESGNYRAIKLVMDGMMIQPCRPGFVDGRDAILEADRMNFNGDHQCMIWEVFARRGLGFFAEQGDSMDQFDGKEDFEPLPTCIKELKVRKTALGVVKPGDDITVDMYYANHTEEMAENLVVTDEIPTGMTYSSSTASVEPQVFGNVVTWTFGNVASLAEESFSVTYTSDPDNKSIRTLWDDIENVEYYNAASGTGNWDIGFENIEGVNLWGAVTIMPHNGNRSWWVEAVETESDQYLDYYNLEVTGTYPVLRFWHAYNTELGSDGGFVLVSTDNGATWQYVNNKFIYNGYNTELQYGTFAIPSLQAFSGQREYHDSYLDLSAFAGQTINLRFRWGSDDNTSPPASELPGWYIDDFELLDLKVYEAQACIDADNAPGKCANMNTTIIDTGLSLSRTADLDITGLKMEVSPNPTNGLFEVKLTNVDQITDYAISLYTLQGQLIQTQQISRGNTQVSARFDAKQLQNGMYIIQAASANGILTQKVVVNK